MEFGGRRVEWGGSGRPASVDQLQGAGSLQGAVAVAGIELAEQVVDVRLHGAQADVQAFGDLLVALATGHAPQHVLLAAGERLGQRLVGDVSVAAQAAQQPRQALGRRQRLFQAELAARLWIEQLAEQLAERLAFQLQQLPEAVPRRQLQCLLQAAQRRLRVAAVTLERGIEQEQVKAQALEVLGLRQFVQVVGDLPCAGVLAKVALDPGVGQPLLRHQLRAVAAAARVPLLEPGEDEVLVVFAPGQPGPVGADLPVQGEQLELPGQAPGFVPAGAGLVRLTLGQQSTGLIVEYPGQAGAVREGQRYGLGLAQAQGGLFQVVLFEQDDALAQLLEQVIERAGGTERARDAKEARAGVLDLALCQFDLAEQQLQHVRVAAEAQRLQLGKGLARCAPGLPGAAQGEQADGAVEQQDRGRRAGGGVLLQGAVHQVQAVLEVAAQRSQPAAQEGEGLVDAIRAPLGYFMTADQPLQTLQAGARMADVVGDDHRARFGDGQGEMLGRILPRHVGEEVDDAVHFPFAQQVETVLLEGGQQAVEVPGPAELIDGLGVVALREQPVGGLQVQLIEQVRILLVE